MGKVKEFLQEELDVKYRAMDAFNAALNETKIAAIKVIREQIKRLGISQLEIFGKNPKSKELQQVNLVEKSEINESLNEEKIAAIKDIREQIKRLGISQNELFGKKFSAKLGPKYQLNGLDWNGKEPVPTRFKEYIANGGRLDDLLLNEN